MKTVKMVPIPDYGDLIPLDEFLEYVSLGLFIPYDGSGSWATDIEMDDNSNVWEDRVKPPVWATHVMWFNR